MSNSRIWGATGLFLVTLIAVWLAHGTGVVLNDPEQRIYIPETLTMPLQIKAAYDGERIFFRYRWPADRPHIYHDMLRYLDGKWQRIGASTVGPQPQGIYEDRLSMLVDDGRVPEFVRYGGFAAIGDNMRFFSNQAGKEEVASHPYLGKDKGKSDVRKFLPATRRDPADWASVLPEPELAALRKNGYFLDFWHWRAHRSNPIGKSDDQFVAEYRYGDEGKGVYDTNWDAEADQPKLMFDPDKAGFHALRWEDLEQRTLGFDDRYYLVEQDAVPFDADYPWKDGDTLPRRVLRSGSGSHADIDVVGKARWSDGFWELTLARAMDTDHPLDDKAFAHQGLYWLGIAVHRDASGSRWHYVSLPVSLGLEREADIQAVRTTTASPAWEQPWHELTLFYPGQVNWPLLNSRRHAGAESMAQGIPVRARHSPEQLALYAVELEFNDRIVRHWQWTLLAGLVLIAGFGIALSGALHRGGG